MLKSFVMFAPYVCFHIFSLISLGNCVATYWVIAAHSAYGMFAWCKYLIVNLVFPTSFLEWESLSDCPFS